MGSSVTVGDGSQLVQTETTTTLVTPVKTAEIISIGTQGPQGIQGPTGPSGGGIITVAGVPSNAVGDDGQYAINSLVEDLYRKVSGVWVRITDLDDIDAGFF